MEISPMQIKILQARSLMGQYVPILRADSHIKAPLFLSGFSWDSFTYARKSHMHILNGAYLGRKKSEESFLDIHLCDLKAYQDGLCNALFIDQMMPAQSKILEIGGGDSRILPLYNDTHECWNLDKFEGIGNGLKIPPVADYRIILDYIGAFNTELPDAYFDLLFSISVLEHVDERIDNFKNIVDDINRLLKPGGYCLHCIDIVRKPEGYFWENSIVEYMFDNVKTLNAYCEPASFIYFTDMYYMNKFAYDLGWRKIIRQDYENFGQPTNITVIWRKSA